MDEYLSDKEQVERLRKWWRENGWFLIGGVAIGLLALYGYRQYFAYQDRQAETAAALYASVKTGDRRQRYGRRGNGFRAAAQRVPRPRLYAPSRLARRERGGRRRLPTAPPRSCASRWSRAAIPSSRWWRGLRLARVLAYREQYSEALAVLNVPSPANSLAASPRSEVTFTSRSARRMRRARRISKRW